MGWTGKVDTLQRLLVDFRDLLDSLHLRLLVVPIDREAVVSLALTHELGNSTKAINGKIFVCAVGLHDCTNS